MRAALVTLVLVAAPVAAWVPEAEVWLDASGHFRTGLVAVGVGAVDDGAPIPSVGVGEMNLHREQFSVNACHRDLLLDLHWTPSNVTAEADGRAVTIPFTFRAELVAQNGTKLAGIDVADPAYSWPLATVREAGTYVLDLYLRTGAEVDWDVRVRGLPAVGEPTCLDRVLIAEVEANPAGADAGHEWVELWNPGIYAVDLSEWTLTATHGVPASLTFAKGTALAADERAVVTFPTQFVDNGGEVLVLTDAGGAERDRTPALTDTRDDDRTNQRFPDGAWGFAPGTPGAPP